MDQTFGIFEIFEVFEAFEEATMAQMHQKLDSDEENVMFEAFAVFEELHLAQTPKIRYSDDDIEVSCGHMFQAGMVSFARAKLIPPGRSGFFPGQKKPIPGKKNQCADPRQKRAPGIG